MAKNRKRRLLLFALFRIWSFFIYLLPIRLSLKIGQCIGRLAFYILKRERNKTLDNLRIAFKDSRPSKERIAIAREVFENVGRNLVEIAMLRRFSKYNIDKYIRCKGLNIIERFVLEKKGAIVLSAHLGNWELLAHYFAIKGFSVNVIARRLRMENFERVLDTIRKRNRVKVLYRKDSTREVVALLKKNEFVGIMPDQDITSVAGVFVDFFGKLAYTPTGPAVLNILTGAPIVPCFILRTALGHEVLIEGPLGLKLSGDKEKDILENTKRYTKLIEGYIRRYPSQWVWFHERWKTRPESLCN